jgi:hypothetical protein
MHRSEGGAAQIQEKGKDSGQKWTQTQGKYQYQLLAKLWFHFALLAKVWFQNRLNSKTAFANIKDL